MDAAWEALITEYRQHLAAERSLSSATVRAYEADLRGLADFVDDGPRRVTLAQLRSWLGEMLDEGSATATLQRRVSCVKGFFAWALKEGHLGVNPALRLKAHRSRRALPEAPTRLEMGLTLEALATAAAEGEPQALRDVALVELLYASGLRVSEICDLKVGDRNTLTTSHLSCVMATMSSTLIWAPPFRVRTNTLFKRLNSSVMSTPSTVRIYRPASASS